MLVGMGKVPGEHVQFNLNFVHILYNNKIADPGILPITLYENYISIFAQMKHHSDSISFFPLERSGGESFL